MKVGEIEIDRTSTNIYIRAVTKQIYKYFQDPENIKKYEAWKAEQSKKTVMWQFKLVTRTRKKAAPTNQN